MPPFAAAVAALGTPSIVAIDGRPATLRVVDWRPSSIQTSTSKFFANDIDQSRPEVTPPHAQGKVASTGVGGYAIRATHVVTPVAPFDARANDRSRANVFRHRDESRRRGDGPVRREVGASSEREAAERLGRARSRVRRARERRTGGRVRASSVGGFSVRASVRVCVARASRTGRWVCDVVQGHCARGAARGAHA